MKLIILTSLLFLINLSGKLHTYLMSFYSYNLIYIIHLFKVLILFLISNNFDVLPNLVSQLPALKCYQCNVDWEDDECWKEDNGGYFGREVECEKDQNACAKSRGGK